jgi:hypothetical protein
MKRMFEACLSLPKNPSEAKLIADNLDALARALKEWPDDAWLKVSTEQPKGGLFERLVAGTAEAALNPMHRSKAMQSASAVADVLRVMWPE